MTQRTYFVTRNHVQTGPKAPVFYPVTGECSAPKAQQPQCEADNSPPSSVEDTNVRTTSLRLQCTALKNSDFILSIPFLILILLLHQVLGRKTSYGSSNLALTSFCGSPMASYYLKVIVFLGVKSKLLEGDAVIYNTQ
jgi:hypothetical protein